MRKLGFLSILIVFLFAQGILAQDAQDITPTLTPEQKAKVGSLVGIGSRPVVYGKKHDGVPERMRVRGIIEEVSFVPFHCGVMCFSGTAKVRLLKKTKGYEPEYAYIVVLCFLGEEKEWLLQYCQDTLREKKIGYFVFGHRHLAIDFRLTASSRYINLGDWIHYFTYAVVDDSGLQLKSYFGKDGKLPVFLFRHFHLLCRKS